MSSSSCCANHTCTKAIDVSANSTEPNVLCPLCVDAVYCSEQCRVMDWVKHECKNAFLIKGAMAQRKMAVFAPYHFEDMLEDKEIKRLGEILPIEQKQLVEYGQRYLMQLQMPNHTIVQQPVHVDTGVEFNVSDPKRVPVYRRGVKARDNVGKMPYEIQVSVVDGPTLVLQGTIEADSIYKNKVGRVAQSTNWLRRFFSKAVANLRKESSDVVIFAQPPADRDIRDIMFPISGVVSVVMTVNGNKVLEMQGPYDMPTKGTEATRAMGKFTVPRLYTLFPGQDDAVKDMKLLRAQEPDQHESVTLIFQVNRTKQETSEEKRKTTRMKFRGIVVTIPDGELEIRAVEGINAGKPAEETAPDVSTIPPLPADEVEEYPYASSSSPPPPARDEDEQSDTSSSSPDIEGEEGESPSSPLLEGLRKAQLKPTVVAPRPTKSQGNGLKDSLEKGLLARRPAFEDETDTGNGAVEEQEWNENTEAQISRKILYFPSGVQQPIECDATNVAQVTGLAMALEMRAALKDPLVLTSDMENVTSVIQKHARNLVAAEETEEVPIQVSTAIYTAIDTLCQQNY